MNKIICKLMLTFGVFIVFAIAWMNIEILLYGKVEDRLVDNIISIPIIFSFYLNVSNIIDKLWD